MKRIRIGNAAGFWGDNLDAPRLLAESGKLDYLTLEYLAELTLSILAHQRSRNPASGFVTDLPETVRGLVPSFRSQPRLKLVTNGGGMNPSACCQAIASVLVESGLGHLRLGSCEGDDLLPRIDELIASGEKFEHFENHQPLGELRSKLASANAYLGAAGIQQALQQNSSMVITGRIADASLVVGPCMHEFGWDWEDNVRLGKATVAGHLIECGAQVTGGMYSNWTDNISLGDIGYPIAEIDESGDCVISKPAGSGGVVNVETVSEQLIYEIGDPQRYMTPDVVADFTRVQLNQVEPDRVQVTNGHGTNAPETFKVSMAYYDGFAVSGMIVLAGPRAVENAHNAASIIRRRVATAGFEFDRYNSEVLGAGDSLPGMNLQWEGERFVPKPAPNGLAPQRPWEVVLRVSAQDKRREAVDRLARELAPLVTSGPPGVTGYTGSRAQSHPVLAYWPSTISRTKVHHKVTVKTAHEWAS
jgi:Acyclic terpene utilisation family protein AtuA